MHLSGQLLLPLPGPEFANYDSAVAKPFLSPRMWGSALIPPLFQSTFRTSYHSDALLKVETGKIFLPSLHISSSKGDCLICMYKEPVH